ncbi:hypothetical protein [Methylorubrum zatmanii]|uniref:Uncharacterized protein n=1 Tax=Methylorubrum zatmanii TaxID=29429 RepID=A0ABW1WUY2_9HYPH|nr:hypothetical protein [Methylorubrum zatmanii]
MAIIDFATADFAFRQALPAPAAAVCTGAAHRLANGGMTQVQMDGMRRDDLSIHRQAESKTFLN